MNTRTIQSICLFLAVVVTAFAQVAPTSQPSSTSTRSRTDTASKPKPESRPFVAVAAQLERASAWIDKPATNETVEAYAPACELRFR
ncbi:MAG: hypothetical protein ACKVS9_02505, partial [Phycisphaerae bacterium]